MLGDPGLSRWRRTTHSGCSPERPAWWSGRSPGAGRGRAYAPRDRSAEASARRRRSPEAPTAAVRCCRPPSAILIAGAAAAQPRCRRPIRTAAAPALQAELDRYRDGRAGAASTTRAPSRPLGACRAARRRSVLNTPWGAAAAWGGAASWRPARSRRRRRRVLLRRAGPARAAADTPTLLVEILPSLSRHGLRGPLSRCAGRQRRCRRRARVVARAAGGLGSGASCRPTGRASRSRGPPLAEHIVPLWVYRRPPQLADRSPPLHRLSLPARRLQRSSWDHSSRACRPRHRSTSCAPVPAPAAVPRDLPVAASAGARRMPACRGAAQGRREPRTASRRADAPAERRPVRFRAADLTPRYRAPARLHRARRSRTSPAAIARDRSHRQCADPQQPALPEQLGAVAGARRVGADGCLRSRCAITGRVATDGTARTREPIASQQLTRPGAPATGASSICC